MQPPSLPLRLLLLTFAGLVSREQQRMIAYLVEENRVLRELHGERRLRLTDDQRRRLAAKGKSLGRRLLHEVCTIVSPDTILRWHRLLIAAKWTHARPRAGRPGVMKEIRELVLRMAEENSTWGYCRIQGALRELGHTVARGTIAKVLREYGLEPSPSRSMTWRTFLRSHWGEIASTDFFSVEVWTPRGLATYYVLFFLELDRRRVWIAGITRNPDEAWMLDVAERSRDFLSGKRHLLCDRDTKFTPRFRLVLEAMGVQVIRSPYRAPNCNAHAERFVRSIKDECLDRMILMGEEHLRRAIDEYVDHYHRERTHQGLGNELIESSEASDSGPVECHERLGGLLRYYRRAA